MLNLCEMINKGEIKFEEVLKMHPFSASSNMLYGRALEGIDYFSELHIKTIETYERLAQISVNFATNYT